MNNYGNFPELNDIKSGVLATNGQKYRNSNSSSSGIDNDRFFISGFRRSGFALQAAGPDLECIEEVRWQEN